VSLAFDRQAIRDLVYNGVVDASFSAQVVLPGRDWALPDNEVATLLAYDPQGARQLLQAAGVSNWSPHMATSTTYADVGQLCQAQLKQVGIDTHIDVMDLPTFNQLVQNTKQYDTNNAATGTGGSPTGDLETRFKTGGGLNIAQISDPELDQLIERQKQEF